jgi:hypothetical protein
MGGRAAVDGDGAEGMPLSGGCSLAEQSDAVSHTTNVCFRMAHLCRCAIGTTSFPGENLTTEFLSR